MTNTTLSAGSALALLCILAASALAWASLGSIVMSALRTLS